MKAGCPDVPAKYVRAAGPGLIALLFINAFIYLLSSPRVKRERLLCSARAAPQGTLGAFIYFIYIYIISVPICWCFPPPPGAVQPTPQLLAVPTLCWASPIARRGGRAAHSWGFAGNGCWAALGAPLGQPREGTVQKGAVPGVPGASLPTSPQ